MKIEYDFSAHPGFRRTFRKGHLTLGIFFPIEAFSGDLPRMKNQLEFAHVADEAGYALELLAWRVFSIVPWLELCACHQGSPAYRINCETFSAAEMELEINHYQMRVARR